MSRSRLSNTQEKKAFHKIILSVVGIIVVVFLLIKVAIPGLINFSLFLSTFGNNTPGGTSSQPSSQSYIMPPILNSTFSATNSATVTITGTAQTQQQVILFINNNPVNTVDTNGDGTFTFSNVTLAPGSNTLTAKAKVNNNVSDFSQSISISFQNSSPALTIDTPHDGDTVKQQTIQVAGKTDPDDRVTVNGFWAIVDTSGQYSYTLTLQNGGNQIKIISQDNAGNQTEKDINVNYSQ